MEEIWKDVEGYKDYSVSNLGRIKSFKQFDEGMILSQQKDENENVYSYVSLSDKNNKFKSLTVHRLVANAFLPKNEDNVTIIYINHIDENKKNNHVNNLEWCPNHKEDEIWKPIKNYEGKYDISNCGRVKSFMQYKDGLILKNQEDVNGYPTVNLYKDKKMKTYKVHVLVGKEFIQNPNPEKYDQINHIDENRKNNHVSNLEWCTAQYNNEYSHSKYYKIYFPDGHIEEIFNLRKFCRKYKLNQGHMNDSFRNGHFHKGYKIIKITDKHGNTKEAKKSCRKKFKILCPDGQIVSCYYLKKFCVDHKINISTLSGTFARNKLYEGFQIVEKYNEENDI